MSTALRPIALCHMTVGELDPPAVVDLAARTGFDAVSLMLQVPRGRGHGFPVLGDTAMRRRTRERLAATGVRLHDAATCRLEPDTPVGFFEPMIDSAAYLGATMVNVNGNDPDPARLADRFAGLCALAGEHGLRVGLEFMMTSEVKTLDAALALIDESEAANAAVTIDALHLARSGGTPADVGRLPADRISYLQLCDGPRVFQAADHVTEAASGRRLPGEGEFPLARLVENAGTEVLVGIEAPSSARVASGESAEDYAGRALGSVRRLLSSGTRDEAVRDRVRVRRPPGAERGADLLSFELYIDGTWTPSTAGATTTVVNPATEQPIGRVPAGTGDDVDRAVAAARRAFDEGPWPRWSVRDRARLMTELADALDRRAEELVELNIVEVGCVRSLAESLQVRLPLLHLRDMAERVMAGFPFETPMPPTIGPTLAQGVVRREPRGVAALISAYNGPTFLNLMKLAPALAAGCTTVLKPAPTTPLQAFVLGEVADEVGLPPGVLNIVSGEDEVGQRLTSHPGVDLVSFTGSDTVGRRVYEQAAPSLKKVILELGGKSANIVMPDADLSRVVPHVVQNMTVLAGQGCSLLTRTLVHESLLDEIVAQVAEALDQVVVGDPADATVTMGPLISAAQRDKVETMIRSGVKEGAGIAYGGGRPAGLDRGYFVEPTLFTGVDNAMSIARKEFFGPVGVVIGFADEEDAVRIANDSEFGLAAGVWAGDPVHAYHVATRVRAGLVYVNGGGAGSSPHTAFGGYKQSGIGLERGEYGLDEFLLSKSIIWSAQ